MHALETTCLLPSLDDDGGNNFTQDAIEELLSSIYQSKDENGDKQEDGPVVKGPEATALRKFLTNPSTRPPLSELVWLRTTAFRLAAQYLDEDGRRAKNAALLKSINVIVHIIETTCMKWVKMCTSTDDIEHFILAPIPTLFHFPNSLTRPRSLTLDLPPSYAPDANTDFTTAVQTLWKLDSNRLTPHEDYKMDVQNSKHPCDKDDAADEPLFTQVNSQIFSTRPTYHAFKQLLDNYTVDTRTREEVTERERAEVDAFLNAIMETAPMKYCHQYCLAKDASYEGRSIPTSENGFVKILEKMWFELYSHSGCGFEHVFVGEVSIDGSSMCESVSTIHRRVFSHRLPLLHGSDISSILQVKDDNVTGFHNWIQFYLEESKGNIDYRGYIKPRSRDSSAETNDDDHVLTLQFSWK